ncbi:MAG TPA: BTAD domain-containing putative transcriptional regulator [Acidimicrobiales bacterium]|nr:BTAD domain-containing putative transcriptional regulator [Acidimicrobiales bacterium]
MTARVLVLGPLDVVDDDGRSASLRGDRQRVLLAVLAAARGRVVAPDALAEAVWGDDLPGDPAAALHSQVRRLRQVVGADVVATEPGGYRLAAELDADRFEALVAAGDGAPAADAIAQLTAAIALWRGPALVEVADLPLAEAEAAALEERRVVAEERLATLLVETGRLDDAVVRAEGLVARHPLRERPVAALMAARHGTGRTAEALRAYSRFRDRLVDELGLEPSDELRELEGRILRGEPVAGATTREPVAQPGPGDESGPGGESGPGAAPWSASDPDGPRRSTGGRGRPRALPRPVSSFVGRSDELAALVDLLGHSRCVTVVGPGGVGKTRLAVEAASAVADDFPDGVDLVRLDAVGDPADVVPAVAGQLRVSDRVDVSLVDRLVDALAGARRLVVLDSCEHVVDAAAALAEALVQRTSEVTVLATSREVLRVDGERTWPVRPLSAGTAGAARERFVVRARSATPHLDPDEPATAELIGEVCDRLDGLPLALELAAARLRVMPLPELVAALRDDVAVLGGGSRTAEARHRSVAALVGWSVDRLTPDERRLFVHAAVFAGPFDLPAAAAVAGETGGAAAEVAPLVWELVDRSLLAPAPGGRYEMLEVVRADGRRRLAEQGWRTEIEARHAAWVASVSEEAAAGMRRPGAAAAVARFEAVRAEVRTVVERALGDDRPERALAALAPLFDLAVARVDTEVLAWVDRVLDALPADAAGPVVSRVRAIGCSGAWLRGDRTRSLALGERAVADADDGPDSRWAHEALGDLLVTGGDLAAAAGHYRRSAELAAAAGDHHRTILSRGSAAVALGYGGDEEAAHAELAAAAALLDQAGELAGAWHAYLAGECALEVDPDAAEAHLERAVGLAGPLGADLVLGVAGLSLLTLRSRRRPGSVPLDELVDLVELLHRSGNRTALWTAARALVEELARRGDAAASARLAGALAASPHAAPVFGPDAERLAQLDAANRAALGARWEAETRAGRTLDEAGALALARAAARAESL